MLAVYIIWALIPFAFFALTIWSLLKPYLNIHGQEHTKYYFVQGIFCLAAFALSVWLDQRESYGELLDSIIFWKIDLNKMRWLLYPLVLCVLAWLQQILTKKEKRIAPIQKRY